MRIQNMVPAVLVLFAIVAVMVLGPRLAQRIGFASQKGHIQAVRAKLHESRFLQNLSDTFSGVAEAVRPSVVHVSTRGRLNNLIGSKHGAGSGWVYDQAGHIVTNHHVVADAETIHVRFADGATYPAALVSSHEATDVAVLKVEGIQLHAAIRASEPVRQGEVVFAFGSPFAEFDFSMSQGVVSATARSIHGATRAGRLQNFIQTDAAINPGNSGGPLTNVYGEIVGMNTAILTAPELGQQQAEDTGTFLGLGFAVPVDMVSAIVDQIIETGGVKRAFLGISFESVNLNDPSARAQNDKQREGVLVLSTNTRIDGLSSPAGEAGIRTGDIVIAIDGRSISNGYELQALIATKRPGTAIDVVVWRKQDGDGEEKSFTVTLGALD